MSELLPAAAVAAAAAHVASANEQLARVGAAVLPTQGAWLRRQLTLPLWLEPDWPQPAPPLPVAGGALHVDVIDEDRQLWTTVVELEAGADAERVAARAQSFRLPVTPYRPVGSVAADPLPSEAVGPGHDLRDARVVDLSAMWAGPLATALLACRGAQVTRVDPACRPDGFRARPRLYRALNGGKDVVDLDLRRSADRARFEHLVAGADLVVDSFSRRVMPNLGYGPDDLRRVNPAVATLSIGAFPADSAERDWVAFGGGIHAASGLGMVTGVATPTRVAYPDAIAGLRAFAVALGLLGRDRPRPHADISLLGSLVADG